MPKKKAVKKKEKRAKQVMKKTVTEWDPVPTTEDEKPTPEEVATPDVEEIVDGETASVSEDDQDIDEILSQMPQETRVELARWNVGHDDWSYAGRYPAQGFSVDRVARERGPGRYRIIIRGPSSPGGRRMVVRAKRHFYIDDSMAPVVAPAAGGEKMGGTLSKMIELNLQMMQTVMTAASQPPEKMSDVVAAVATLMQPQQQAPQENPIELAVKLLELTKGNDEKSSLDDMLGIMDRMREWVSENDSGGGGGLGAFAATMSKFLDVATKEREEQRQLTAAQSEAVPTEPAPVVSESERIQTEESEAGTATEITNIARNYFEAMTNVLTPAAERDADPALYADLMLDSLPVELEPYLDEWILTDDYPAVLYQYFPGVDRQWLQKVLFIVKSVVETDDEIDDDRAPIKFGKQEETALVSDDAAASEGEPGNAGTDGASDAAPSKREPDKP